MGRGMRKDPDEVGRRSSAVAGSVLVLLGILLFVPAGEGKDPVAAKPCQPTRADSEGPFYKPGAPGSPPVSPGFFLVRPPPSISRRKPPGPGPSPPSSIFAGGSRRSSSTSSSSRKGEDPRRYSFLPVFRILGYEFHSMVPPEENFLFPRCAEGEGRKFS